MPDKGKLLIVEMVLPDGNDPHQSKILDLSMLVLAGGTERTAEEFSQLLDSTGFRLTRIIAAKSPLSIIEAVKKQSARFTKTCAAPARSVQRCPC